MIIKRYMGSTTQEAMAQVKADLGSEAIILNTRRIRQKGIIRWFTRPIVEVTAAIDNAITSVSNGNKTGNGLKTNMSVSDQSYYSHNDIESKVNSIEGLLKTMIKEFDKNTARDPSKDSPEYIEEHQSFYDVLIKNGVGREYADQIIGKAAELYSEGDMDFKLCFERVILDCLGKQGEPITISAGQKKIILFVGPTGVGKTTTLAKLAAGFVIEDEKKVGFITADTYRIAAVDQLKVYADILGIPMEVIYSPQEITVALSKLADRDIILIDTPGRSIRDKDHEREIKDIIDMASIDETYLVISGNTSFQGCVDIFNSYKFLSDYKLILTKIDEVTTYGTIINCRKISQKSLSYITTGQNVPADIEIANANKIIALLAREVGV